jgi:hypothetical protein
MGYRSNVIISLDKPFIDKMRFIQPEKIPALFSETVYEEAVHGIYLLQWEDIKWYEDFDDIKEVLNFLSTLDEDVYRFHRLGEDLGDYEILGELDDHVYTKQEFEIY